jgi:hypothetical protein
MQTQCASDHNVPRGISYKLHLQSCANLFTWLTLLLFFQICTATEIVVNWWTWIVTELVYWDCAELACTLATLQIQFWKLRQAEQEGADWVTNDVQGLGIDFLVEISRPRHCGYQWRTRTRHWLFSRDKQEYRTCSSQWSTRTRHWLFSKDKQD